jgi:hypothetical protein
MGDTQATATALITALFFLFLSSSRPLPRLSPRRPPSSVLSPYIFCSIIAQARALFTFITPIDITPSPDSVPKFVAQKPDSVRIRSKFTTDRKSFPRIDQIGEF